MVTCTGHIGIHKGAYVRTDVHDVMAIKPKFLTSMGYHIFLTMVLRARSSAINRVHYDFFVCTRMLMYCCFLLNLVDRKRARGAENATGIIAQGWRRFTKECR